MASLPTQIAKYQIVRRLGHGGMGAVYLGRDPDLDRSVAIKVLREPMADEELLQRFLREARAAANLRHENLITIYEVGSYDQQPFIAMEYVDGATLGELIRKRQPLPLVQKLSYIEQICSGLHHAHRVGIVHRDIKPANLMVDAHGVIRILDFGIARVANSGMTSDGALIGTLNYMSPEQMLGRPVDFRSDIFSLGAVAYELICYQQAFPGSLDEGLLQRLPQMPPAPLASVCPGLPPGLEEVVMRALAKAPLDRFTDLEEMRSAIRHLRAGVDPRLELETVVIPSRDKPKASTPGSSSAERRGLLERRARQIAVHRDAARAALARGDLDSAAAACDDALTLDPDDAESTQLLADIQHAKEQRDQESKARRERERSIRQRVADAEVTLGRGDVASAARLLQDVFDEETRDPAALALLDKVRDAATAAGVTLPEALNVAAVHARTEAPVDVTRLSHRAEPPVHEPERRRLPIYAAAAIVVVAIGGGIVWMISGERTTPATEATSPPTIPEPSNPPAATNPSSAPVPQAPSVTVAPAPATPPAPVPAPAATVPTGATDALASTLARIAKLHESGDVPGALAELTRIGSTTDKGVSALAQSVAQSAFRSMAAAQDAAVVEKAEGLAPVFYAEAERTRSLAHVSQNRGDFVEAGTRAWNAAEAYRKATTEARAAALVAKAAAKTPPASPTATPEPPRRGDAPTAPPSPTSTVAPRPSALDAETPGILRALDRYKDAYSQKSVEELEKVFPALPSEKREELKDQFRNCRAFAVTFLKPQIGLTGDSTATVTVQSTYSCTPRSRQSEQSFTVSDIFQLSKVNDRWLIDGMGMMDNRRRR